jgi:hypothetical protein
MTFESKLASLITSEMQGRTVNNGEIAEAMTRSLGKFIAISCGGDAAEMGEMLERTSAYLFVVAADTQQVGKFLANAENWSEPRRGA